MKVSNDLIRRSLKSGIAICIFMALFFAYQIPGGIYQTYFKEFFLILALIMTLLVMNFNSETNTKWKNIILITALLLAIIFYWFEY